MVAKTTLVKNVTIYSAYLILVLIGSFTGLDLTVFKIENVP